MIDEVNVAVTLEGMTVAPGDLIHGDANGVLVNPGRGCGSRGGGAIRVRADEKAELDFVRAPGLTVEKLRQFQQRYRH